jgi:hypothetical protein
MALDLYRIALGVALEDADGTARAAIITGTGAPGGDAGVQDDALVGSIYLRTDASGSISASWQKITDTNTAADWVQSASKDYVDAAITGLSWREPVLVLDGTAYADVTAVETAANVADLLDGETIAALDRVLLTNIANNNTIAAQDETDYDAAGSNGTFSAGTLHANGDVITMSDGSTITVDLQAAGLVTEFTITTGSTTPIADGATVTQISTTGIGINFDTTPGTNNTTISSPDLNDIYIVSGSTGSWTLTTDPDNAATDGDATLIQTGTSADQQWVYDGVNWVQFGGASSQAELGYIRAFVGKTSAGSEMPTYSSTNYVTTGQSLEVAIGDLDAQVGTNASGISTNASNISTNASNISTNTTNIGDLLYTEDNYVTDGQTLTLSIDALDIALAANSLSRSITTTITGATSVDTLLVDDYQAAKWFIAIFDEGDLTQKFAAEIWAIHDGTASGDATEVDWNEVSRLKLNGNITGLDISVVLTGTSTAQTMDLQVTSTDSVTVHTTRIDVTI